MNTELVKQAYVHTDILRYTHAHMHTYYGTHTHICTHAHMHHIHARTFNNITHLYNINSNFFLSAIIIAVTFIFDRL